MKKHNIINLSFAVAMGLGLAACSEKTSDEYLAQGNSSLEQQKVADAIVQFKNAVRVDPKNAAARLSLGLAYLSQGVYVSADKELEQAIKLGTSDEKAVLNLAVARAKLGDVDGIKLLLENHSSLSDQNYQGVLFYAGVSSLNANDNSQGQDYLQQAKGINPSTTFGKLSTAYSTYANGNIDESLATINDLLANAPLNREALILQGHLRSAKQDYAGASESFAKHVEIAPKDYAITLFLIQALIRDEQYDKAETLVDDILARFKDAPLAHQYKSQIEFSKEDYRSAIGHAEIAIKSGLQFDVARMVAGVSAYKLGELEQAYSQLKNIEDRLPPSHPLQKVLAVVKAKLGYTDEALENYAILEGLTQSDVDILKESSLALVAANDFNSAQTLLNKAQALSPDDPSIAIQKGALLLSQKDLSGLQSIEYALKLDPSLEDVELSLALQYLRFGLDEKAQAIADKWLNDVSHLTAGQLLQGIIAVKHDNKELAIKSFETVLSKEPENLAALYNLAILSEESAPDKANTLYEKIIELSPNHLGALNRYSLLAQKTNSLDKSITFIEQLSKNDKSNIGLMLGLAQNYRLNGDIKEAIKVLESIKNVDSLPDSYWIILGDSYTQNRQLTNAKDVFSQAVKLFPQNYILHLRMIGVLEIEEQFDEALTAGEEAYRLFPNNTRLEMLLAYYEMLTGNESKSNFYLTKLKDKNVVHPFIDSVKGQTALANKQYEKAITEFSEAYNKQPTSKYAIHLSRALLFSGKRSEAEKVLEQHIAKYPDEKTRMLLASLYSGDDLDKRIEQYKLVLIDSPNNIIALNNLSWALYQTNQLDQAKVYSEKAYKLNSNLLPILETHGVILSELNDSGSFDVLEKAINAGSKDAKTKLAFANQLINKGSLEKAKRVIEGIEIDSKDTQREVLKLKERL